jgi:hypothetical protein
VFHMHHAPCMHQQHCCFGQRTWLIPDTGVGGKVCAKARAHVLPGRRTSKPAMTKRKLPCFPPFARSIATACCCFSPCWSPHYCRAGAKARACSAR